MFVVCAWCNRDMGEKEPLEDTSVTHGMCKACLKKELRKGERGSLPNINYGNLAFPLTALAINVAKSGILRDIQQGRESSKEVKMDSSGDITGTIKELRHKLGLTWEQFAARVGVSVTTVARWESGKHKPSPMAARRLKELERETTANSTSLI